MADSAKALLAEDKSGESFERVNHWTGFAESFYRLKVFMIQAVKSFILWECFIVLNITMRIFLKCAEHRSKLFKI